MRFLFDHHFSPRHVRVLSMYDIPAFALGEEFPHAVKDVAWIPLLGGTDWVVVTCDQHIQTRKAEALALRESGASAIFINPFFAKQQLIKQGEWLLKHWPAIMRSAASTSSPFYWQIKQNGAIDLVKF